MTEEYKYKAFISYSHRDKSFAKWLHKRIENYKIPNSLRAKYSHLPKNLKRSIFRDEDELPTASELSDNLLNALDKSERLIVICSPSSVDSKWVDSEIKYFKHKHGEDSVLAILKDGEPNATDKDDISNEAFPNALRHKVDSSGELTQERTEPIAGDARSYWEREMALMKMIAGILKVDFADLWEREKRERNKRRYLSLGVVALFIVLSIYSLNLFSENKFNNELEEIKNNIAAIEYSIKYDNWSKEELLELHSELIKLKKQKINKENTQKSLEKLNTSIGMKAKSVYYHKGAKEAIQILTSRGALVRKEMYKEEVSLEAIALAKLYIEISSFVKAKQSYMDAISLFYSYENVKEYAHFLNTQNEYDNAIKLYNKLLKKHVTQRQELNIYQFILYSLTMRQTVNLDETKEKNILIEDYTNRSLKLARKLAESQSVDDIYHLAMALTDSAVFYTNKAITFKGFQVQLNKQMYKNVVSYFEESLELNKKLLNLDKENTKFYELYALTLFNQGKLYQVVPRYDKAEDLYYKALSIYEKLMTKGSQNYMSSVEVVVSQIFFVKFMQNFSNLEAEEKAYLEIFNKYKNLAKNNSSLYCAHLKAVSFKIAQHYQKNLNYKAAESIYQDSYNICSDDSVFNRFVIEGKLIELYFTSKQLNKLERTYQNLQQSEKHYPTNEGIILDKLASMYAELNEFDKVKELRIKEQHYYEKFLKYWKKQKNAYLQNNANANMAISYNSLAKEYVKYKKFNKARELYEKSLLIFKKLVKKDPNRYKSYVAETLQLIGYTYYEEKKYQKAELYYKESISIYKGLALKNPKELFIVGLGTSVDILSVMYAQSNKYKEAIEVTEELMEIMKQIEFLDFTMSQTDMKAFNLMRLGSLYKEDKQLVKAEKVFIEALSKYRKLLKQDASTYMKHVAYALRELGDVKSRKEEYKESESYYKESLSIYKELVTKQPKIYYGNIAWNLNRIGELYEKKNQYSKAKEVYSKALNIYKDLKKENPGVYDEDILWTSKKLNFLNKSKSL